jgi:hypothetical protein
MVDPGSPGTNAQFGRLSAILKFGPCELIVAQGENDSIGQSFKSRSDYCRALLARRRGYEGAWLARNLGAAPVS